MESPTGGEMEWFYDKGSSPLERLPNEMLHEIWLLSMSLDLPRASPTLSSKIQSPATRTIFAKMVEPKFDFTYPTSNLSDNGGFIFGHIGRSDDVDASTVKLLIASSSFTRDVFRYIRKMAKERLETSIVSTVTKTALYSLPSLKLPPETVIPSRFIEQPRGRHNLDLLGALLMAGATLKADTDVGLLLQDALEYDSLGAFDQLLSFIPFRDVSASVLDDAITQLHAEGCVIHFFLRFRESTNRSYLHRSFANFDRERYPALWASTQKFLAVWYFTESSKMERRALGANPSILKSPALFSSNPSRLQEYFKYWAGREVDSPNDGQGGDEQ
ncbi:hypothetical protein NA57DRAFT_51539 [Rhizodiscina lignyota]|uniref:Uncharacterized protein n=1 Tax=Rhizodiscina lignyota TaxID=1504668 RepID=A0A9P4IRI3_9PEZI|nr:hypothetical protein NA57DRAFT_51539 [Rhizodiscina lignyota]